jgi:hypothetical protein
MGCCAQCIPHHRHHHQALSSAGDAGDDAGESDSGFFGPRCLYRNETAIQLPQSLKRLMYQSWT